MKTFPSDPINISTGTLHKDPSFGLTKREYFAALAMHGMLANIQISQRTEDEEDDFVNNISRFAVEAADDLIEELNK